MTSMALFISNIRIFLFINLNFVCDVSEENYNGNKYKKN